MLKCRKTPQLKNAWSVIEYIDCSLIRLEEGVNDKARYVVFSQLKFSLMSDDQDSVQLQYWPGTMAVGAICVHCCACFESMSQPRKHFVRCAGSIFACEDQSTRWKRVTAGNRAWFFESVLVHTFRRGSRNTDQGIRADIQLGFV